MYTQDIIKLAILTFFVISSIKLVVKYESTRKV